MYMSLFMCCILLFPVNRTLVLHCSVLLFYCADTSLQVAFAAELKKFQDFTESCVEDRKVIILFYFVLGLLTLKNDVVVLHYTVIFGMLITINLKYCPTACYKSQS